MAKCPRCGVEMQYYSRTAHGSPAINRCPHCGYEAYTGRRGESCWYCNGEWGNHGLVCGFTCPGEIQERKHGLAGEG